MERELYAGIGGKSKDLAGTVNWRRRRCNDVCNLAFNHGAHDERPRYQWPLNGPVIYVGRGRDVS
jgi:hypothetical protein